MHEWHSYSNHTNALSAAQPFQGHSTGRPNTSCKANALCMQPAAVSIHAVPWLAAWWAYATAVAHM